MYRLTSVKPWQVWRHSMLLVLSTTMQQCKCVLLEITGQQCSSSSIEWCAIYWKCRHNTVLMCCLMLYWALAIVMPRRMIWTWYTSHWWVGCYNWYSEEGPGQGRNPPKPILAVPNVKENPSTASVPIAVLLYNGLLLYGFTVPTSSSRMRVIYHNWSAMKQRHHPQSVAEISHHSVLSGGRIRQCETSSGSRHKDTDQCL